VKGGLAAFEAEWKKASLVLNEREQHQPAQERRLAQKRRTLSRGFDPASYPTKPLRPAVRKTERG